MELVKEEFDYVYILPQSFGNASQFLRRSGSLTRVRVAPCTYLLDYYLYFAGSWTEVVRYSGNAPLATSVLPFGAPLATKPCMDGLGLMFTARLRRIK